MTLQQNDKVSNKSADPFETGDAWRQFLSLESSMKEFVDYVPLDRRNRHVFSPKLGTILISAATQVEATFKAIIKSNYVDGDTTVNQRQLKAARKAIQKGKSNLQHYRAVLEPYFLLSKRRVTIGQYPTVYRRTYPFRQFRIERAPVWWERYNLVKHSYYDNIKQATLRTTFSALVALFLIQVMHLTHRKTLVDMGVIKSGHKDLQIPGLTRGALKELVSSSPRQIPGC